MQYLIRIIRVNNSLWHFFNAIDNNRTTKEERRKILLLLQLNCGRWVEEDEWVGCATRTGIGNASANLCNNTGTISGT